MAFEVNGRRVGPDEPCFIIAEAGVNYDNNPERARLLVDDAQSAGCDAVKFQTYKAEKIAAIESPLYWKGGETTQREAFGKLDKLSPEDFARVVAYSRGKGLPAFSTPFDLDAVDFLESLGVPLYKIASGDITYMDLVRKVASTGKPILLSTGASVPSEIERALRWIEEEMGCDAQLVVLACTLCYPTEDRWANLRQLEALKEFGYPVGLSDHTQSTVLPAVAVALGACVIEKHFTLSRDLQGSADHQMSMDPRMMALLVRSVRSTEAALGEPSKIVFGVEGSARVNARRSVAAAVPIFKGGVIRREMLTALRPAGGVPPWQIDQLVGLRAMRNIQAGETIYRGDVA